MSQLNSKALPFTGNARVTSLSQVQAGTQLLQQQPQLANMAGRHSVQSNISFGTAQGSAALPSQWYMDPSYQSLFSVPEHSSQPQQFVQQLAPNGGTTYLTTVNPSQLGYSQAQLQQLQYLQRSQIHDPMQLKSLQQQQLFSATAAAQASRQLQAQPQAMMPSRQALAAQPVPISASAGSPLAFSTGFPGVASHPAAMPPATHASPANPTSTPETLPSFSRCPMIRDVWASNVEEEFAVIRSLITDYPYVAMDTEFPGVVATAVGSFKEPAEFYYQNVRINVNMLKLIQVGLTLLNEKGEVPEHCSTWQFNFAFSKGNDTFATDSIHLLEEGGIDFSYFSSYGIDMNHFASLLLSSGLVCNPEVRWLSFHAGYDFGYLTKILYNSPLPEQVRDFMDRFHLLFPSVFDIKYLLRHTSYSHSLGLDFLSEHLRLKRFGRAHQAGSDSLLTGHCYFRLIAEQFKGVEPRHGNGILYGLTEDTAAAESGSAGATNNVVHQMPS